MVIRRLKNNEWTDAMALAWRTFLRYDAPDYEPEGVKSFYEFITDADLEKMFNVGEYIAFGAFDDGEIVGVAGMRAGNFLSLLFVEHVYQKRGIGMQLVGAVADYVRECNHRDSILVYSSPYARDFYLHIGFVENGGLKKDSGMYYYPMRLSL